MPTAIAGAVLSLLSLSAQQQAPQYKLPRDQRDFDAARALADPEQRLRAFRVFTVQHGDSLLFNTAGEEIVHILLQSSPGRTAEVEDQVKVNVENASRGVNRWQEEATEADLLASAEPHGASLRLAQRLAEDANTRLTEDAYNKEQARIYKAMESPLPPAADLHESYVDTHVDAVLALAHVYLDEGKHAEAKALLQQAVAQRPRGAEAHALLGELALSEHHDAEALTELETAHLLGQVSSRQLASLQVLFTQLHPSASLDAELDARYTELYPPVVTPAMHTPATGGHTALLEFYTGAACAPCAGADAAFDALLQSYSTGEVVALAFDEHVPAPDPLANAATTARADLFEIVNTPNYLLDGKRLPLHGGDRAEAAEIYRQLAVMLDEQSARASGVQLQLKASLDAQGVVHAEAQVSVDSEAILRKTTAAEMAPARGDRLDREAMQSRSGGKPQPELQFALVEDNIRYSGENGVRFHRRVVRALSSDANRGTTLEPGRAITLQHSFDVAAVSASLAAYLNAYEHSNDRFGEVHFRSRPTVLQPQHLAVAAWVQDAATHRVLQAAFAPVTSPGADKP